MTKVPYEVVGGVAVLTLDEPPANTYSYEMMRELDAAILDARMDDSVHVIVLTGAGEKFFCAGATIGMLREATPDFKYYFCLHANETMNRLEQTPKLVIAALNGHTVGGGLEMAMAADLRIARKDAGKLGFPKSRWVCCRVLVERSAWPSRGKGARHGTHGEWPADDDGRGAAIGLVTEVWDETRLAGRSFLDAIVDYAVRSPRRTRPAVPSGESNAQCSPVLKPVLAKDWRSNANCSSCSSRAATRRKGSRRTLKSERRSFSRDMKLVKLVKTMKKSFFSSSCPSFPS